MVRNSATGLVMLQRRHLRTEIDLSTGSNLPPRRESGHHQSARARRRRCRSAYETGDTCTVPRPLSLELSQNPGLRVREAPYLNGLHVAVGLEVVEHSGMRMILLAVVVSGCAPLDGYPCEKEDAQQCDGRNVAFCEKTSLGGLKWKTYDCPSGCDALAAVGKQRCDWRSVAEGAACPKLQAFPACSADGEIFECGTGVWHRLDCPLCQKDKRLSEVGANNCNNGFCSCR
jgi:hypothetical protein